MFGRPQAYSIGSAMSALRRAALACCWTAALCIFAQLVVWCLASFTDLRSQKLPNLEPAREVVVAPTREVVDVHALPPSEGRNDAQLARPESPSPLDPNIVPSSANQVLRRIASLALGFGSLAVLALIPIIGMGVVLGAGAAATGVERSVSAFTWSIFVAALTLPISHHVGLPWHDGALVSYQHLLSCIDRADGLRIPIAEHGLEFYARFVLLPVASVVGLALIGLKFADGVASAMPSRDANRLDPALEREAANIRPSSLHGGRNSQALRVVATPEPEPVAIGGSISQPVQGVAPRRLI